MMKSLFSNVKESITLNLKGYIVRGVAVINTWGGPTSTIQMNEIVIDEALETKEELYDAIRSLMNDAGFGCREILGAFVAIYAAYSNEDVYNSSKVFVETTFLDKTDTKTPKVWRGHAENVYYECL